MEGQETATLEQELQEFLKPESSSDPATGTESPKGDTAPGATPPAPGDKPAEATDKPAEENDPLKALENIKDDEKPEEKPEETDLSPVQKEILQAIPDEQAAVRLLAIERNYGHFVGTMENGNFDATLKEIEHWNRGAHDGLLEHIYEKFVKNGAWVDRFIAEQEGRGHEVTKLTQIERELAEMKRAKQIEMQQAQQQSQQSQAKQTEAQNFQKFNAHVEKLFDQINFNKSDRKYVIADLNQRIVADKKLVDAIRTGKPEAVNKVFKEAAREYLTRDKEVATETADKIKQQTEKKPLVSGGTVQTENELPDDIKQVPKGQEDQWLTQKLTNLFRKKK